MFLLNLFVFGVLIEASTTSYNRSPNPSNASLLWGPYRPNLYLGIRPRLPKSLLVGLMWSNADDPEDFTRSTRQVPLHAIAHQLILVKSTDLRHTCEQNEGMAGYGWTAYDVRNGGTQSVNDTGNKLDLITEFAKVSDGGPNGSWGLRVKGIPRANAQSDQKTTLIVYLGSENPDSRVKCTNVHKLNPSIDDIVCDGTIVGLGNFRIDFPDHGADRGTLQTTAIHSLTVPSDTIWQAKSILTDLLRKSVSRIGLISNDPGPGNLHFVQKTFQGGFEFDVLFSSDPNLDTMNSSILTQRIQHASSAFSDRFESIYAPQAPFQNEQYTKLSQSLLSNLMGGIGYFDGTSKVDVSSAPEYAETHENFWEKAGSAQSRAVVEERGPYQLFSAVPSRPFFPRGFLWDEGFHLQVILDWDMDLALEIVSSWFDMMDEKGWMAREQILGPEARTKVPSEFQTQYPHYANPPTLFFVVETFLAKSSGVSSYSGAPSRYLSDPTVGAGFLKAIYPKLKKHYEWFCLTQAGNMSHYQLPSTEPYNGYRWRGRTPQHTLTSGLDDYPRAQPPHPEELHLDALCWVGSMAIALKKISAFLGESDDQESFSKHATDSLRTIDGIHWSETDRAYCDTTVVSEHRVEKICHKGYISLFPFLVNLMSPNHTHLEAVLKLIRDPEELWSAHGLRSLSLKDEYYGTGENYWKGPVWININYMALQRLLVSTLRVFLCSNSAIAHSTTRNLHNRKARISRKR
jgi:mannosyl-oligosaccharide glucosidase